MIIRQVIKTEDGLGFEITETEGIAPTPSTGDLIQWTSDAKTYTAQVESRSFAYDNSEVSFARNDDWGVTITVMAKIIDISQVVDAPREVSGVTSQRA